MDPKERLLMAIRQQPVDRMPVMTYNFHPFTGQWRRSEDGTYLGPSEYQPMMDAVWRTNTGMLCKVSARHASARQERTRTEQTYRGTSEVTLTYVDTPKGTLHTRFEKPAGQPGYYVKSLITDDDDLDKYLSLSSEPASVDLSDAKRIYDEIGGRGLAYLGYADPMYAVAHLFDFEDFCLRCITRRSLIVEMIEREFERIRAEMKQLLEQARGYDFLLTTAGPEVATPPMLSPQTFAELVTPYERALVQMIHDAGHLSAIHCHGRVRRVLDQFLEIGIDALEPMEPPPQGDISLEEALDKVAGKICLMGYVQDQHLYTARPGEMRVHVCAVRGLVEGRTGYIMTSTATPYMDPPPSEFVRNYVEYLEAAAE
jgi:hypothetical protein